MSGWLEKRGGQEATKVNFFGCFVSSSRRSLLSLPLLSFTLAGMEEAVVYSERQHVSLLQEWFGKSGLFQKRSRHFTRSTNSRHYMLNVFASPERVYRFNLLNILVERQVSLSDAYLMSLTHCLEYTECVMIGDVWSLIVSFPSLVSRKKPMQRRAEPSAINGWSPLSLTVLRGWDLWLTKKPKHTDGMSFFVYHYAASLYGDKVQTTEQTVDCCQ